MFVNFSDTEICLRFKPGKEPFIRIQNFSFFHRNIPVRPVKTARVYFMDINSDESLSERSVSWKENKERVTKLLQKDSSKSFSANVILSGYFELVDEKIIFTGTRLTLRSDPEKTILIFGDLIKLKDPNEPKPKSHSCD